jgi:hypothetical protein
MKVFTLSSYQDFILSGRAAQAGPVMVHYPKALNGLRLDRTDRTVVLGGERRIAVSKELLESNDPEAVQRDGTEVVILRASLKRSDTELTLVPETVEDKDKALLKSDIFGAPSITYEGDDNQIAARISHDDLGMHHEIVLAELNKFEPLNAVLSGKRWRRKGWKFYREACVKERLPIKFDGQNIFYEILRG